jgi:CxxC-x17-CxxC domain-containing protein
MSAIGALARKEKLVMSYGQNSGGSRRYDSGPREMHKIKCSDCGAESEVPFKPTEGRPVYCRGCFDKHRPPRRDTF